MLISRQLVRLVLRLEQSVRSHAHRAQSGMGSGAGLGLAIVKQLVEQNQGRITVESTLGQGTNFAISFPLVA